MKTFVILLVAYVIFAILGEIEKLPKWLSRVAILVLLLTMIGLDICLWKDQENIFLRAWLLVNTCGLWRLEGAITLVAEKLTTKEEESAARCARLIFMCLSLVQFVLCCKILL